MEYTRDEKLFDDDAFLLDKISSPLLAKTIETGRQVRLAAVHRWDIAAKDLWYAMLIPEMLEDKQRAAQVARVFDLVCAATVPGANPLTLQAPTMNQTVKAMPLLSLIQYGYRPRIGCGKPCLRARV